MKIIDELSNRFVVVWASLWAWLSMDKYTVVLLGCSMQVTEEVSSSQETSRTTTVQETTTAMSGDHTETFTVTSTVTEVTSSGDAPNTGKGI